MPFLVHLNCHFFRFAAYMKRRNNCRWHEKVSSSLSNEHDKAECWWVQIIVSTC